MKQEEFRKWLVAQGHADATASSRVSSAKRVEQYLGDLDELFAQEDRDNILNQFSYTAEDERAERPNPSPVPIDGVLRTGLASLQQALKLYHTFQTEQSNVPDKAQHHGLLDRLTRKEVDTAMQECDQLGLKAFLARGGFASPQVWVRKEGSEQSYPAKATVAAALGQLPDGLALAAKEFFNGFGEAQSFAKLEALGYRIRRKGASLADDLFSRDHIEGAMDAYEQFRTSDAHADAFSGFGDAVDYWVRSTRPRQETRFPSKPIVGYLLGRGSTEIHGGWGQKQHAAARLHDAGYVIVDQHDKPLPLPDKNKHLMRGAERARLVALNYFIEPAREAGLPSVTIRAGDLHDMCGLVRNWPNVCQALEGEMFQRLASVSAPSRSGPERSTTTEYTFVLNQDGVEKDEIMTHADQTATQNLILYGPPGTGKTYQTAWEAVRLCMGNEVADKLIGDENRKQLMAVYQSLVMEERIEFVTFHQSMSYEEFIEGLQPSTGEDVSEGPEEIMAAVGFRLKPTEGVFKRISERARLDSSQAGAVSRLDRTARVFKVALGLRHVQEDRIRFGLDDGLIHIGWGGDIDWSDERFDDFNQIYNEWRSQKDKDATGHDGNIIMTYSFRSDMQIGDYVVMSDGRDRIRAFGRITGDYYFERDAEYHPHRRSVDWIWRDDAGTDRRRIYGSAFRRHAVYKLNQSLVNWDALEEIVFGKRAALADISARDHVLIIDEINRANISKVFGELITLLEPDKRLGRRDEIQLTLPYSKKCFGVPPNLHIIGTMNTADRSIALLDTALRRRFTFKELMPNPEVLPANVGGINLQKLLATINDRIEYLFDREHQIGHAYFTGCTSPEDVEDAMRHKVIPLLSEYFYEDWSKVAAVLGDGPQGPSRFLEARRLTAPPGIAADDFSGERLRWRVKDQLDFSEFAA